MNLIGEPIYNAMFEGLLDKPDYRNRTNKMTTCTECTSHDKQTHCGGYEKASHEQRCMWLVYDKFCTNNKKW